MTVIGTAEVIVRANTRLVASDLEKGVRHGARSVEPELDKLSGRIGGLFKGKAGQALQSFGGQLRALGPAGNIAAEGLAGLSGASTAAAGGIAAIGLAAFEGVSKVRDITREVRALKNISGLTAEEASVLRNAFDDFGVSVDAIGRGFFFLGRNITTNEGKLRSLGLTVARNQDGTADLEETFLRLADAVASTEDPGKRLVLIQSALGRGGKELLPILTRGGDELRRFLEEARSDKGLIFNDQQLRQAEDFDIALRNLGDQVEALVVPIGNALIPALTSIVKAVGPVLKIVGDLARGFDWLSQKINQGLDWLDGGFDATQKLREEAVRAGVDISKIPGLSPEVARTAQSAAGGMEDFGDSTDEAADQVHRLHDEVVSAMQAQLDFLDADLAAQSAKLKLKDSIHEVTKELAEEKIKGREAQQAILDVEQDALSLAQAQVRLAEETAATAGQTLSQADKTRIFKRTIEEAAQSLAPNSRIRLGLLGLTKDIHGVPETRQILLDVKTEDARRKLRAFLDEFRLAKLPQAALRFELQARGAANGGEFRPGEFAIVGEGGKPEVVEFKAGGGGIVFPDARKVETGAGVVQNFAEGAIQINQVSEDAEATARAVSYRMGTAARR